MPGLQTCRLCRRFDVGKRRLTSLLAIGAVADDAGKASGLDRGHITQCYLRRD